MDNTGDDSVASLLIAMACFCMILCSLPLPS